MNTTNTNPTSKKSTKHKLKFILIWCIITIIALCTVIAYLFVRYKDTALVKHIETKISTEIQNSTVIPEIIKPILSDTSTIKDDFIIINEEQKHLDDNIKNLQQDISEIKSQLSHSKQQADLLAITTYKLIDILKTDKDFHNQADIFLTLSKNSNINALVNNLINKSNAGIPIEEDIKAQYEGIYKNVYMHILKNNPSLSSSIKYLFSKLIFIKNTSKIVNDNKTPEVIILLNAVELELKHNNLQQAYEIFSQNNLSIDEKTFLWQQNLQNRILANSLIKSLEDFFISSFK